MKSLLKAGDLFTLKDKYCTAYFNFKLYGFEYSFYIDHSPPIYTLIEEPKIHVMPCSRRKLLMPKFLYKGEVHDVKSITINDLCGSGIIRFSWLYAIESPNSEVWNVPWKHYFEKL